ncbi:hypothetical protein DPMN_071250 [Dreissena polymorpha]|uniref:Uncharacterized protein n=1 Tax=Dreissena polymorpha TaxID=45954 RepID=A0A9D3Z478_DREPO|nr:hypothetical protein DPMN_071250 [Dreissena polymorpha]
MTSKKTNVLTKFHEDWTKNVTSRVFKCFHYIHIEKSAPPPGGHFHDDWAKIVISRVFTSHVFHFTITIFKLIQEIIGSNLLTKFHEDRKINVASRVFTRKNAPPPDGYFHEDWTINVASRVKNAPPPWRPLFTRNTAPPPGGHVFQRTGTIFKLYQHMIFTSILSQLHEDWASNVTSTVFTSFELLRGVNRTNVLTKFHENRTINVACGVYKANVDATRQSTNDARRTTDKRRSQKLTMSTAHCGVWSFIR